MYSISQDVTCEIIGSEVMAFRRHERVVLRIRGREARILAELIAGTQPRLRDRASAQMLTDAGVLEREGIPRRTALGLGAAMTAGIAVATLPTVASAASADNTGDSSQSPLPGEIEVTGYWAEADDQYQFTVTFTTGSPDFPSGDPGTLTVYVDQSQVTVPFDEVLGAYVVDPYVGYETQDPAGFTLSDGTTYYARFEEGSNTYFVSFLDEDDWNALNFYSP